MMLRMGAKSKAGLIAGCRLHTIRKCPSCGTISPMQFVIGGTGFIGTHVTRAFLDLGESCVITRHRAQRDLSWAKDDMGKRLFIEPLDVGNRDALLEIGKRHAITGIVHLASGPALATEDPFEEVNAALQGLLNVLFAARTWGVRRDSIASTIGVYGGVKENVFHENDFLPLVASHAIPTFKKVSELLAGYIAGRTGLEVIHLRISAAWGPGGRPTSSFFALPGMVHSAFRRASSGPFAGAGRLYAEDGLDLCYVKDIGRAIALVQLAKKLNHSVYNIGSGRATRNREVAAAIMRAVPESTFDVTDGYDPKGPGTAVGLDIARIQEDAGYTPGYNIETGIADYVTWLRAGNER